VIPEFAQLRGTIRTFDEATTSVVLDRIREVTDGTAATFGVTVDFDLDEGFPLLVNDPACVDAVERVAGQSAQIRVINGRDLPIAGGEDFAYFAATRPSAYFFLGAGKEGEDTPTCHHPDFDFDDELLPVGIELFLRIVADRMSR
jgi:metal-dependent amidase/aminoacylase/carboxypeptidase family protein